VDYSNILLITDMDGTLLSETGENAYLSNKNKECIEEFIRGGGTFSVASGRNMQNVFHAIDNFKLNFPYTLINGAMTCHHETKKIIESEQVNQLFLKEALDYYHQRDNVAFIIADENKMYALNKQKTNALNHGFKWDVIDQSEVKNITPLKLAFAFDPKESDLIYDDLLKLKYIEKVQLIKSSPYFIEIVNNNVSKGNAIKKSIYTMGMHDKTLICVGDYLNDESMLEIADYAFVTSNAHPKLKDKYTVLSSSHNDDIMLELLKTIKEI
jgi:Cof subfamily protein (haloacid dehalogenase superfamily)